MLTLKRSILIRKIIISAFIIINIISPFAFNIDYTLLNQINFITFGMFAFNEKIILALIIWIVEILSLFSLFISKSIYKFICSIALNILCIVDIGVCIYLLVENVHLPYIIIEIIIDIVFMVLMIYDIIKSNKEYVDTSDEKFFKER